MVRFMKTSFTLFFLSFLLLTQSSTAQTSADRYSTHSFTASSPELSISTTGGAVRVSGSEGTTTTIEVFVRSGRQYLKSSDISAKELGLEIVQNGNEISIKARPESRNSWSFFGASTNQPSVSFHITTPTTAKVTARTSGGSMSASNLSGELQLRTSGGSITVNDISSSAELRTSGGSLSVRSIQGSLSAQTSGGSISVTNAMGNVAVRTSGGSISIKDVQGSVTANTSGGSISASNVLVSGLLDVRTSGGSVSLKLLNKSSEGFDLDLRGNRVNIDLVNFSGRSERGRVEGRMNGGGIPLSARTSGGGVSVTFAGN